MPFATSSGFAHGLPVPRRHGDPRPRRRTWERLRRVLLGAEASGAGSNVRLQHSRHTVQSSRLVQGSQTMVPGSSSSHSSWPQPPSVSARTAIATAIRSTAPRESAVGLRMESSTSGDSGQPSLASRAHPASAAMSPVVRSVQLEPDLDSVLGWQALGDAGDDHRRAMIRGEVFELVLVIGVALPNAARSSKPPA